MAILTEKDIENIKKAGRIAYEIKQMIQQMVRPGVPYLEIAERVEEAIRSKGGEPAFPCNISWGHEAAHYSPYWEDSRKVPDSGILKIDFGVMVRGMLSDTSVSIDLSGENEDLIKAAQDALDKAISVMRPDIQVWEISSVIEKTIKSYGLKPVSNLTGHAMEPFRLHAGVSIPNVSNSSRIAIRPGMLIAIEPFTTKGLGYVVNGNDINIYSFSRPLDKKGRRLAGRLASMLEKIYEERRGLPFSERWLMSAAKGRKITIDYIRETLKTLATRRYLIDYPVLVEPTGLQVAQAEDTVLVLEKEVIVTTRPGF